MQRSKQHILIEVLVIQARSNDERALADLFEIWNPVLFRRAYQLLKDPHEANDVTQEAWLAMMKGLNRLKDAAVFPAWSLQIVNHKANDLIRRNIRERKLTNEQSVGRQVELEPDLSMGDSPQPDDVCQQIKGVIQKLPSEDQQLLNDYYQENLSVAEISKLTGRSVSAIKSKLFQLRQKIKSKIERQNHEQ